MVLFLFLLGGHAMVAQIFYIREALAAHGGQEGLIGIAFALWFLFGAVGAGIGRRSAAVGSVVGLRWWLGGISLGLAIWPVVGGEWIARGRGLWAGSAYAPLSPGLLLGLMAAAIWPTALGQGLAFSVAAHLHRTERRGAIGPLCGADALGAMAGGLWMAGEALTGRGGPVGSLGAAAALALGALAQAVPGRVSRGVGLLAAGLGLGLVLMPGDGRRALEMAWEQRRWVAGAGRPGRLLDRRDSPYQRLVLAELGRQRVLYANGQALFLFPDPAGEEPLVFTILARQAAARDILVIGAASPDFRRVLLHAAPKARITEVEADGFLLEMLRPMEMATSSEQDRWLRVTRDPMAFARLQPAEAYDLIVLRMPEPTTLGQARFYTVEFYEEMRRLLRPSGVLWTSVEATELLGGGMEVLPTAVWKTLRQVFPKVSATYGERIAFFAGREQATLPMDPRRLESIARLAGWQTPWFDPAFFRTDEGSDPIKRRRLEARLEAGLAEPLRQDRPLGHLLAMMRWGPLYGANWVARAAEAIVRRKEVSVRPFALGTVGLTLLAMGIGGWWRRSGRGRAVAIRVMVGMAGFSAMALELTVMFLAQTRRGYLYQRLALLTALFMAGHAAAAWTVRRWEETEIRAIRALSVAAGTLLAVLWAVLAVWMARGPWSEGVEEILMAAMMLAGGLGMGGLVPMANRLLRETGRSFAFAAGEIQAADLLGAMAGAMLPGLVLLPLFGVRDSAALMTVWVGSATLVGVGWGAYRPQA